MATKEEFMGQIDARIRNVSERIDLDGENEIRIIFPQKRGGWENYEAKVCKIWVPTKGATTKKALAEVNSQVDFILAKAKENADADAAWAKTPEGIERCAEIEKRRIWKEKEAKALKLAEETGQIVDEHGSAYARGDHFSARVISIVDDPDTLKEMYADTMMVVVEQDRKRVYAKSSKWYPSTRTDGYLVGRNENGIAFAHSIPVGMRSVHEALSWIWNGNEIVARNGDVGVAMPKIAIKKSGVSQNINVIDSHYIDGEILTISGVTYARNAMLYHEKGQHAPITIGNEWRKIVVARRCKKSPSTSD